MQTDLDALPDEPCTPVCPATDPCSPCEIMQEYDTHKRFTAIENWLKQLEQSEGQAIGIGDVQGLQLALNEKQPSGEYAPAVHNHANATTSNAGFMSANDKSKLNNVQSGATLNQTDAFLLNRANHAGTQAANTISDFAPSVRGTLLTGLVTAVSRILPVNTDSIINTLGKIVKYLVDLKPIAFSGNKADIGLGNVDDTSDLNKPVSIAVQNALNGKANSSHTHTSANVTDFSTAVDARITAQKGTANGLATLVNGILDSSQWPAGIDDVVEYATLAAFPVTGVQGKIYIAINDGNSLSNPTRQYRWSGSTYVLIPSSPGSSDSVPEGTTNLYFTEGRVKSMLLTGLSVAASRVLPAATDDFLTFAGKVLRYCTDFGSLAFKSSVDLSSSDATGTLSNSKLAQMPSLTFKGNVTGVSASPQDVTVVQMRSALKYARSQEFEFLSATGSISVDITDIEEAYITVVLAGNVTLSFTGAARHKRVYITVIQGSTPATVGFTQTINFGAPLSFNTASGKVNTIAFVFDTSTVAYGNSTKYA